MPAYALVTDRKEHTWTDELKTCLRQLWADKFLTCERIADRVNALFGTKFTKNSIIGAAKRIGLEKRRATPHRGKRDGDGRRRNRFPIKLRRKSENTVAPNVHLLDISPNDLDIPIEQRKRLLDLGPCDCRWPVGNPGEETFFFCGAVAEFGKPYCAIHCARAFVS